MTTELHEKVKEWAIYANFVMLLGAFLTFVFNFYALPGKVMALEDAHLKTVTVLAERSDRFSTIEKDIDVIKNDVSHNGEAIHRVETAQNKFFDDFRRWAVNEAR